MTNENGNYSTTAMPNISVITSPMEEDTRKVIAVYYKIEFASAILLLVLAAITVPTNILLLSSIWKDPLKCFKKPTTPLIIGLAVADLLTGLTTEPFFAFYYIERYIKDPENTSKTASLLYQIGQFLSTVTVSSSFLIVLVLSWLQYVAIAFPLRYKAWITRRKVLICVISIWLYFTGFSLLHFAKIDQTSFLKADLFLHPTLISVILLITLVLLYKSFNKQFRKKRSFSHSHNDSKRIGGKRVENIERQFTIVTIYLAGILLVSILPYVVVQHVFLYCSNSFQIGARFYTFIALRIRDLLLFIKIALDAFIYAWRLPMYRRSLQSTIASGGIRHLLTEVKEDRPREFGTRSDYV